MLVENTLFEGKQDKVKIAIERLKTFEPPEGYYLAFSGGKDSIVIKELASISGVKYDAHYNCTGLDAPELTKFIREYHGDVKWSYPPVGFFRVMSKKAFPTRAMRWCCEYLKEGGGADGSIVVTGIRWSESSRRNKRNMMEPCLKNKRRHYLNAIIDWTDNDVWDFIKTMKLPYCNLYDEGYKRLGCILCPMTSQPNRLREAKRYPRYTNAWRLAFKRFWFYRIEKEISKDYMLNRWANSDEMFDWWLYDNYKKAENPDQLVMFE